MFCSAWRYNTSKQYCNSNTKTVEFGRAELTLCIYTSVICLSSIKHQRELAGKSTATHACVLAPNDVHIYDYPVRSPWTRVVLLGCYCICNFICYFMYTTAFIMWNIKRVGLGGLGAVMESGIKLETTIMLLGYSVLM